MIGVDPSPVVKNIHWVGFYHQIYRKPWFLPSNIGLSKCSQAPKKRPRPGGPSMAMKYLHLKQLGAVVYCESKTTYSNSKKKKNNGLING